MIKHPNSQVSYKFYCQVFRKDFENLSFGRPKVDTCKKCDQFNILTKNSDPSISRKAKTDQEIHHRQAEKAFDMLCQDSVAATLPGSDTFTVNI